MSFICTIKNILNHPINKHNKINAVRRFIKWQIGSRLVDGDIIINWVNNSKFIARTGETGVTGNIYCGLHEFPDMTFLLHFLTENDLFIDIGANVGSYTILASSVAHAQTYCFEPVPGTFNKLINNININKMYDRVKAFNLALGERHGEILFSSDQNCMNHVITKDEEKNHSINVKISTLDEEIHKKIQYLH